MKKTDNKKKKTDRSDKFTYSVGDIKFKVKKKNKEVKESYSSFTEFLFEKEAKFIPSTMRWITIKDERNQNQHILIKKKDGTILGGMGGKHNGEKLDDVFDDLEDKRDTLEDKSKNKEQTTTTDYSKEIEEFREEAINEWGIHDVVGLREKNVTSEEYDSINEYTSSSYSRINNFFRDYNKWYEEMKDNAWADRDDYDSDEEYEEALSEEISEMEAEMMYYGDNISNALKKHKSEYPMITYRGLAPDLISKIKDILEPGNEFTDDGFASSSTNIQTAVSFSKGGYVMEIHIPEGSRAASVKHLSNHAGENEVLIDKGSDFFIKEVNHKDRTIVVELKQN